MTVISTIITSHYTAHASDSFLTEAKPDGTRTIREKQQSKLIRVPAWRGILGYWGLARYGNSWKIYDWLSAQAKRAGEYNTPAEFADALGARLNDILSRLDLAKPTDAGLGIHFSAYERVTDYWVPELFVLSNWTDATYTAVQPIGFRVTRETYATLKGIDERTPEHGKLKYRLEVHAALHSGPLMFRFNNGDPILFNRIADTIIDSFSELARRRQLKDPTSYETHLSLARSPIDIVSKLCTELQDKRVRLVGGKPHDLAVSPGGLYESRTGD